MEIKQFTSEDTPQALLTKELAEANEAYRNSGIAKMSDFEYDKKLEKLKKMEEESGFKYNISPTDKVGATVVSELKKVKHEYPALSLDKVKYKDRESLIKWLKFGSDEAVISWKLDGLTVCALYEDGKFIQAVTRGDGIEGSDITHNAVFFKGLPREISYKDRLIVRGEAVMKMAEFERVNALAGGIYENPRNLASATIQMLDANESKKREINFYAFELVYPLPKEDDYAYSGVGHYALWRQHDRLNLLEDSGFQVVDHENFVVSTNILNAIENWKDSLKTLDYPTDGLVITYDNMAYGMSLGNTGHHFRHSLALKWTDETVETTIRNIEWSVGKTGNITPVAIFDEVRLGLGSNVTRASLHNLSIMKNMPTPDGKREPVMIGAKAEVYLANMIIPQIATIQNMQNSSGNGFSSSTQYVTIPTACPVCGEPTRVESSNGVEVLHCDNVQCPARQLGSLMNTFSKDGLFVKGLGESQIADLMELGLVNASPLSFYEMASEDRAHSVYPKESDFAAKVSALWAKDGWGTKKWNNLIDAINASRKTTLQKFLYSLNIPLLGNDLSKKLSKYFHGNIFEFTAFMLETATGSGYQKALEKLIAIDGIGYEKAKNVADWMQLTACERDFFANYFDLIEELDFTDAKITKEYIKAMIKAFNTNWITYKGMTFGGFGEDIAEDILNKVIAQYPEMATSTASTVDESLSGLTFVITGAVNVYKNRDEFKASVEARGGKVAGSVSAKTSFLVNNDIASTSGKNAKAKELNIPIISEAEFIEKFGK